MLVSLFLPAHAAIYIGNPEFHIKVDRPAHDYVSATVELHQVDVHLCTGGADHYVVDETIDLVDGWSTTIEGGNICGITLEWASELYINGPSYVLGYDEQATELTVGTGGIPPVALSPFDTLQGSYSGAGPVLYALLD